MKETLPARKRPQSLGEEIANSVSHGIGLIVALIALPILVIGAMRRGDWSNIIGTSVFALSLILLYLSSTLYHALPANKAKRLFQVFDHAAIFLLIPANSLLNCSSVAPEATP